MNNNVLNYVLTYLTVKEQTPCQKQSIYFYQPETCSTLNIFVSNKNLKTFCHQKYFYDAVEKN